MNFVFTHRFIVAASSLLSLVWLVGVFVIAYREAHRDEREARQIVKEYRRKHL